MVDQSKEMLLGKVLLLGDRLVKEANSMRGETKKTRREYDKALNEVCKTFDLDREKLDQIIDPQY